MSQSTHSAGDGISPAFMHDVSYSDRESTLKISGSATDTNNGAGMRQARALERIARILAWVAGTILVIAVLSLLSDVLLLLFAAILAACLLRGAANAAASRLGGTPGLWLSLILLLFVGIIAGAIWLRGPTLITEIEALGGRLNDQFSAVWDRLGSLDYAQQVVHKARAYLSSAGEKIAGLAAGAATSTLGGIGSLAVILIVAIYLAASPGIYVRGTLRCLPKSWRPRGAEVMHETAHALQWWFVGQVVDMVMIGVLTWIGLSLLGVKLAGTLALIAALCNFVPYVGAIAGAVPAVLVAFGEGPQTALYVGMMFAGVQALEGNVIAPIVQKSTVDLPPVLTILSQTVLGTIFGPVGLILATPIFAVGMVAVRMIYVESILGDHDGALLPPLEQTPDGQ
ncbi:putative membrane spanning protein [Granulibacter bethesdensis]|nr:putative membrane spanning protein [Granulibacter bethesdensis]